MIDEFATAATQLAPVSWEQQQIEDLVFRRVAALGFGSCTILESLS
jgi:hypothetical protein